MQKAQRVGEKLVWDNGNVLSDGGDAPKKFYAVVVMCGHVGDGYFVPILFPVQAQNLETAKLLVKNFPRVKNQIKGCILGIKEISKIEYLFIRTINLHDPYITYSTSKVFMFSRKIMTPDRVKIELEKLRKTPRSKAFDSDKSEYIKVAEDYPENYVLQRYFAPRKQKDKIVFPRYVDMDLLLRDYFVERTNALGINRKIVPILAGCYKIFGANNQFGLTIADDKISFAKEGGKKCVLDLDKFSLSLLKLEDDTRLSDALRLKSQSQKEDFGTLEGSAKTGLERFKARWQSKNSQGRSGKT